VIYAVQNWGKSSPESWGITFFESKSRPNSGEVRNIGRREAVRSSKVGEVQDVVQRDYPDLGSL